MVLVQIPISGYNIDGTISMVMPCNLNGRYNVNFIGYIMHWTTNPNILLRVNSQSLNGNFVGNQLIVASQNTNSIFNSGFNFICDKVNGQIDLKLTALDGTIPLNFVYSIFYFDFEKIKET